MTKKEILQYGASIIGALIMTMTGYFAYTTREDMRDLKATIVIVQAQNLAQYKEVKQDYSNILKDYLAKVDYRADKKELREDIKGIRVYLRKEDD